MSLSDRLKQARTQRLIAAGVLPAEIEMDPAIDLTFDPASDDLFAPVTIEVPATGLHLVSEPASPIPEMSDEERSTTCPNCNSTAHLDMVDLVGHTVHFTCQTCGTMWQAPHNVDQSIAL